MNLLTRNGFKEIERFLDCEKEDTLKDSFKNVYLAVNVLKHGRGHSYNALVERATGGLPFQIKLPSQSFFDEGNVSEISTLIQVDSAFVTYCADLIRQVSKVVQRKSSFQTTGP
jgi:hypothetical protein